MKFETSLENLYFVVYETMISKWSITISYVNRLGRKSKNWKSTQLIDQGFMRMLYGLIREVRKVGFEHKLGSLSRLTKLGATGKEQENHPNQIPGMEK